MTLTALPRLFPRLGALALVVFSACALQGCAVVAVVDTAASIAVGTVGLAADAAIGTARIAGSAVGAAADAVLPGSDKK
jgi:hypothetical protein